MKRRSRAGGKPVKTRRRKAATPKGRNAPKAVRRHSSSVADQETKVARLTRELHEALEQQTATAEVLQVINASAGDLVPVFDAMLEKAMSLCGASFGGLWIRDGDFVRAAAARNMPRPFVEFLTREPVPMTQVFGHSFHDRRFLQIADLPATEAYRNHLPVTVAGVELGGIRTFLGVPLRKDGSLVGIFAIYRQEVRPFSDKQIALLENFASEAVIAMENARLFNEAKESLARQTATADILKVIASSPSDVQPVFDAIAERSKRLVDALSTSVFRLVDGVMHLRAFTPTNPEADAALKAMFPAPLSSFRWGEAVRKGEIFRVVDTEREMDGLRDLARLRGFRSMLFVPLLRSHTPIGLISVTRVEPGPFVEHHVQLLQTFADQAVIAIENVRLFDELLAKIRDLSESLQQQTATADVLKVISRSTFDLQTVLDTLTESAVRLCAADRGVIFQRNGGLFRFGANYGFSREAEQYALEHPLRADRGSITGRVALEGRAIHIPDVLADHEYQATGYQKAFGYRTNLGVPLLREGTTVGVFSLTRDKVSPFTEKQIELATTFADQAVIAIENVRLFDEVQTRTRELARSVEELQALGEVSQAVNSTLDLETVLTTIVGRAVQLSRTDAGAIYVFDEEQKEFRLHATYGMTETMIAAITERHIGLGDANIGAAAVQRRPIQVPDIRNETASLVNEIILREGYRSILIIPLLRPDHIVGALVVRRKAPGEFPQSTIELLQTFADQSVVAIQNARLFENVEARTRELAKSLEELRTAQDRLVQTEKLASLGQLTAGIAHEIKNPLNFVNNFSAISVELIDELRQALGGAHLDDKLRGEIGEIADMLQGNLDKVVQHGKRADAIVKNMLLHSRQGSGEHRPADINALVEESLNLAYHGARAEKQGFNITLERSFDPAAGQVDLFPQEITRVLLNLISNGFYAATKRKAEASDGGYEPTLTAATKNLGDSVEIMIRDNGTGIPPEVREKLFNPFFTTKPAGEGTGLGLSISHDVIVKQHGGSIEVDTQPGEFTEFRIVLPRAGAPFIKSGERA